MTNNQLIRIVTANHSNTLLYANLRRVFKFNEWTQTHKIHVSNICTLSACHIHVDPYQCPPKLTLYKSLPKKIIHSSVPYCTYNVHDAFWRANNK